MTDNGLVAWLTEQLDAEEAVARAAQDRAPGPWEAEKSLAWAVYYAGDREVFDTSGGHLGTSEYVAKHIALWDPARVLAEVAAKRRILALHRQQGGVCLFCTYTISSEGRSSAVDDAVPSCEDWPCDTVRLLAAPCADQPGYRPEWAVTP